MLWGTQHGDVLITTNEGIVGTLTPGTAVPSHATTADTAGTVTEIISAANNVRDSWGISIFIHATGASGVRSEAVMDILIGGATDDVLISGLICGYSGSSTNPSGLGHTYFFPLHIPAGVRIAARLTSRRTAINSYIIIRLHGGCAPPFRIGRKVTTYGTRGSASSGQNITIEGSGASASTVNQITASTSEDHFCFALGIQPIGFANILAGSLSLALLLGASTEERVGTWRWWKDAAESMSGPFPSLPAFREIAAGSRLSLKGSSGTAETITGANYWNALIYAVS